MNALGLVIYYHLHKQNIIWYFEFISFFIDASLQKQLISALMKERAGFSWMTCIKSCWVYIKKNKVRLRWGLHLTANNFLTRQVRAVDSTQYKSHPLEGTLFIFLQTQIKTVGFFRFVLRIAVFSIRIKIVNCWCMSEWAGPGTSKIFIVKKV